MKHVLPLKEKEIEQRRLEAEARKVQRMKDAEGEAEARKIETAAEADSRRKLSDADAYRIEVTGKANAAQMARDSALIAKNPLLIQKTLADKLSRQDPGDRRAAVGGRLLRGRPARHAAARGPVAARRSHNDTAAPANDDAEASNMTAAAIVLVALVADDPAVLRNAPRDDAPAQATLWRGDWLEVRGETAGFLGLRPPPRAPRLHPPDAGARPPAGRGERARAGGGRPLPARRERQRVAGDRLRGARPAGGAGRRRHQRDPGRDRHDGRPAGAAGVGAARRRRATRRWPRTSRSPRATA